MRRDRTLRSTHQASSHRSNGCALAKTKDAIERHSLLRKEVADVDERRLHAIEVGVLFVRREAPCTALLLGGIVWDIGRILRGRRAIGGAAREEDIERVDRD